MIKILSLVKYGDLSASTRQRFIQFERYLAEHDIVYDIQPLLDNNYLFRMNNNYNKNYLDIIHAYKKRLIKLTNHRNYNAIIVHYELFPYAPGYFESIIYFASVPVIFDYDDAIFHQYDKHRNPIVRAVLGGKLKPLLRRADLAICGNAYLRDYAARFCRRAEIVPTVLDTALYTPADIALADPAAKPVLGWIGSPSTWSYVAPMAPMLSDLAARLGFAIRVVGAGPRANAHPQFTFLEWSEADEIRMIQGMDIGIMPLPDEPWTRGKCGYKLIQYMACGLPVVASPVGVNAEIVTHGVNGFLASTPQEWAAAIETLIARPDLRRDMGRAGRARVEERYSLAVQGPRLAGLIRSVVDPGAGYDRAPTPAPMKERP